MPILVAFLLGVILSVGLYFIVLGWENDRISSEFDRRTDDFILVFQSSVARTQGVLRSLAAFNAARCEVKERGFKEHLREFREFSTCSLSCHSETMLLGWAPRIMHSERDFYENAAKGSGYEGFMVTEYDSDNEYVKAGDRDEYFPIYNVEPHSRHKALLGYDLSSDATFSDAILKARDSGKSVATKWLLVKNDDNDSRDEFGYYLFLPLFKGNVHYDSIKERREHLSGFTIGYFLINDLMESTFGKFSMEGIDIHMYDRESYGSDKRLIYKSRNGSSEFHVDSDDELYADGGLDSSKTIFVGNREWEILFHITPKYIELQKQWESKGFLAIGLILTSILVAYLLLTAGETAYVEKLVEERTVELADINTRLENEVKMHMQTGAALQESEENYRNIFTNAQAGLFRIKISNGEIVNANMKFARLFGFESQQEVIAEFALDEYFSNPDEYKRMLAVMQKSGEIQNFEAELVKGDGEPLWVRIWARIYLEKCFIEGVMTDITEEKEIEAHNKRLQSQLLQSQKIESIGRLAGGIAHDFNNMLTGIIGYTELALADLSEDHSVYRKLKIIESSSQKAAVLTKQLLAFSRKQILDMRVVNPNLIVENIIKLLERVIEDNIQLTLNTKRTVNNIIADPIQVEQILMNLVVNASDAMPDGGHLTVETKDVVLSEDETDDYKVTPGKYVMLAVSDTGVGMSNEVKEKIYEPFFTTKQIGKGTGLGLSTVFGIVKQHKGYIALDTKENAGSTFRVYLPIAKEVLTVEPNEPSNDMETGDETILVVDDEKFVCNLLKDTLEPLGYKIMRAYDSDEALRRTYSTDEKIDLLLTDVVMPGVNGKELGEAIMLKRPDIKVIYMSGYTDDVIVHHGVLKAGVEFIQKPLMPREVAKSIREVLDRDKKKKG